MSYQKNEYEWCVMERKNNNRQCTILCHSDDLKMSHIDPENVPRNPADMDEEYGNIAKITTTRGKIHKYLGMTID